jgi:hypothetical protein
MLWSHISSAGLQTRTPALRKRGECSGLSVLCTLDIWLYRPAVSGVTHSHNIQPYPSPQSALLLTCRCCTSPEQTPLSALTSTPVNSSYHRSFQMHHTHSTTSTAIIAALRTTSRTTSGTSRLCTSSAARVQHRRKQSHASIHGPGSHKPSGQ